MVGCEVGQRGTGLGRIGEKIDAEVCRKDHEIQEENLRIKIEHKIWLGANLIKKDWVGENKGKD